MSSEKQEALQENVTRLGDRSQALQESLGQLPSQSDLLENIWKLESLFHNHTEELQQLSKILGFVFVSFMNFTERQLCLD